MAGKRANGEGSIFPYRTGYAAYVWVTQPDGSYLTYSYDPAGNVLGLVRTRTGSVYPGMGVHMSLNALALALALLFP